eukprot:CAMPEP_0119338442 /NCGR_PEP_ID=MMETSP1333-20130426/96060_1 /TAXON_ID=418940 /ORGANISM="Scyphosphaera apsteinii, Strain RCC1455" /LENGTH=125 /DNA_ID=CAMNT_0007349723 /DNA_START=62 /DNA_END=439 /DNA_ORIENTATION=-
MKSWEHGWQGSALISFKISHISVAVQMGLHNPLMKYGGFPVIDGIVTSYNTAPVVARNALLVPLVEWVCPSLARFVVAVVDTNTKHYIDGAVVKPITNLETASVICTVAFAMFIGRKLTNKMSLA